jgi:cellulose synthase/poly-beta-1,6-N-acetylglucosamine synthase-like glycosyltransferase
VADALLTVVVCTHSRPADLERCLAGFAALEDPVEVIVVDSASDPPCKTLVGRYGFRYLYEPVPGLSRARNLGFEAASCSLVAFVDDDAVVAPDWASRLAAAFADPDVGAAGGTCRAAFAAARPPWLSDRLLQYAGVTRFGPEARDAVSSAHYPFGANLCVRRSALLAVGGFSEALGRVGTSLLSNEEAAALDALRALGWRVRWQPDAVVDHTVAPERCTAGYYWRRLWWQGVSRARGSRSPGLIVRLVGVVPLRLVMWVVTRDRVHLYRTAETAGYLREIVRAA